MLLERRIDKFEKESPELVLASARAKLDMILANAKHLLKVRNGAVKLQAAQDFDRMIRRGEDLTSSQLSYIDGILEAVWAGAGYESINVRHDKPKGLLRHPR